MSISVTAPRPQKGWLFPREGLTADVIQEFIQKTILNPALTLPLLLLSQHTNKGRAFALDNPTVINRLRLMLYLGAARWINGVLNQGALNNWQRDKFDWANEIVLITGGSDGFGKLLVHHFAEKNKNTRIINMDIVEPKYNMPSKNCHFMKVDLSNPEEITSVSRQLRETFGHPTVVVLNAGMADPYTILNMPDHVMEKTFQVNTFQLYRLAREFVPHIAARNHGMIVTVASLAGYVTPAGLVPYCSTKSAAVSFHEGLSTELVHRLSAPKVRTICITPNFASTKLAERFINASNFISPTMYPETVADAIFEKIMGESSGTVAVPKIHSWFAQSVRSWPWWMQKGIAAGLQEHMLGFATRKAA